MAERINAAFEAGDIVDICHAIGAATRQHNITDLARRAGIERTNLYRAFAGGEKRPNFSTVLNVLHAMGLELHVTIRRNAQPIEPARQRA
jgi:probable addiction module antidote protein